MKAEQIKIGRFQFEECWVFPNEVIEFIKFILNRLNIKEKSLCHVFCGKSKIGGLRIDNDKNLEPDLVAECLELPDLLGVSTQANIIADLPWKIPFGKRRYYSYAMRDICKVGGYLIINAPWSPWVKGLQLHSVWKVTQRFNSYRDLVDFWIFQKIEETPDL